jgi:acyl-coenzyme A synthetase/AMP-(fatty) acid ligase
MPLHEAPSLWEALAGAEHGPGGCIWDADRQVALRDLIAASTLARPLEELRGRCVLLLTSTQLAAALALVQIDGVAARLVLCPPDFDIQHLPYVVANAKVDVIVSDLGAAELRNACSTVTGCSSTLLPAPRRVPAAHVPTEWILFTSGTSDTPKMVCHSLFSLTSAIKSSTLAGACVWSTFYDIRRYGGLQIFLRALCGNGSLVLSDPAESPANFLVRAASRAVSHITGTPSHWRRALMSGAADRITPRYVRLSGEIADQPILDALRRTYPLARIVHAFASTEGGVGFEIEDGRAGIPQSLLGSEGEVQMKIVRGSLHIRSARTARSYLGAADTLLDAQGYVDTGDILELRDGRYYFIGRRGGIINVGGLKVHPEEVEAVLNEHPRVQMSRVQSRRSSLTGAVVVADVVLKRETGAQAADPAALKSEILASCQRALPAHKVPAVIRFVTTLDVTPSGKVARLHA